MATEWRDTTLGELIQAGEAHLQTGPFGTQLQASEYVDEGVPLIAVREIKEGYIELGKETVRLSQSTLDRLPRFILQTGDIVFARKGGTDRNAIIREDQNGWFLGSDGIRLRLSEKYDRRFFSYVVRNPATRAWLRQNSEGTTMPSVNQEILGRIPVRIPDFETQRTIASILGALDDKIELNRRMNATLEAMAQALFKEWFVDGAKEEWEEVSIYEFAKVIYGAPFASKLFNVTGEGTGLIRIRDLRTHELETFTTEVHPKGTLISPGDIVVGMDGEFRVHHWHGLPAWLNQRVCTFQPLQPYLRSFLGLSLVAPMEFYERSTVGTTVIHLGKSDIDEIKIPKPPEGRLKAFADIVEPMLERRLANAAESRTLASLRDTLLPKLMRGEVRVKEKNMV